jgi:intracellular sulfur oxidation DsrE/DsrF family protein
MLLHKKDFTQNKGGFIMKKRSKSTILTLIFLMSLFSTVAFSSTSQEDDALKDLESVRAVIDFRTGNPKMATVFLEMIHETFKGKEIASVTKKPEFVIVFLGPSVKLISNQREGASPEDQKMLDVIAGGISEMAKDGIKFEICLFAARMFNVDPATVLTEIKHTENGMISLIGYQAKDYSLIPIY